jgi:methionyl aminopeptidase
LTIIKSSGEIALMRKAGSVVGTVLQKVKQEVKPGIKTRQLDLIAVRELEKWGAKASFKGYRGFPASLCVSVNEEIVHGIPGDRVLNEGDLVSLDFGAYLNGFHGDAALTVGVGKINDGVQKLLEVTEEALMVGIEAAQRGARLGDISHAIQDFVETRGYSVVREYCGHGIGRSLHEDPQVPNFGAAGKGPVLQKGMALAIEPMVTTGDWRTKVGDDGWAVSTADNSLSAHFEHTIAIGDGKPEILTVS